MGIESIPQPQLPEEKVERQEVEPEVREGALRVVDTIFENDDQLRQYIVTTEAPAFRPRPEEVTQERLAEKREGLTRELGIEPALGTSKEYFGRLQQEFSRLSPQERMAMLKGLRGAGFLDINDINLGKINPIEEGRKPKEPINNADRALMKGYFLRNLFGSHDSYVVAKTVELMGRFDAAAKTEIVPSFQGDLERWLNEKIISSRDPNRYARAHNFRSILERSGLTVESRVEEDGTEKFSVRKAETEKM